MNENVDEAAGKAHDAVDATQAAANTAAARTTDAATDVKQTADEAVRQTANTADDIQAEATGRLDALKESATEQFNEIAEQLSDLKDQAVSRVSDLTDDIDIDALKARASDQFDAARETLSDKYDDFKDAAAETIAAASVKFDELKAEAADQLDDMPARLNALKEQAADKIEDVREAVSKQIDTAGNTADHLKATAATEIDDVRDAAAGNVADAETAAAELKVAATNKADEVKATLAEEGANAHAKATAFQTKAEEKVADVKAAAPEKPKAFGDACSANPCPYVDAQGQTRRSGFFCACSARFVRRCVAKPFGQGSVINPYSTKTTTTMESLSDNSQHSNFITDPDQADTKYSTDGAETSMVKLVDGKLVPMGDTHDDVSDDQILGRATGSDEERGLNANEGTNYEKSAAALRGTEVIDPAVMPENPMAEAEITGNPDAGYTVESGLPSEDAPLTTSTQTDNTPNDRVQPNGSDLNSTQTFSVGMMMPQVNPIPTYPDPSTPVPAYPDAPSPIEPIPGNPAYPEIPEIPGTPSAPRPEIQEPFEPGQPQPSGPDRIGFVTYTSSVGGSVSPDDNIESGEAVPGNQYEGLAGTPERTGLDDEGMSNNPDTGRSARPYEVDAEADDSYEAGERPNEAAQMQQPHGPVDESSVMEENMLAGTDRTAYKSTDGLN